ncbi:transposase [Zunongwangia pacifica]|uniref:Transposase n=1 Tax=Zunongwangia pacifica TaxID=2911062 RepID=A0A9X2CMD3_9FLAO|nr:transposase [Zunongwangia pacifica]MCL6221011.1 transposase [Zunongwangia pacifica]
MKSTIKLIQKSRKYSEAFKKSIVKDFESGKFSVPQLERIHTISNVTIYRWIYKYSTINQPGQRIVEMENSSTKKLKSLEAKVKELECMVGQKQIQIDYLEKVIDLANQELHIDLKKNSNTPLSNGSVTKRK